VDPRPPAEGSGEPPRLEPRGLDRPAVDESEAQFFGRPAGISGAFDTAGSGSADPGPEQGSHRVSTAAPDAALAGAFGRPADEPVDLQRPPGQRRGGTEADSGAGEPFWDTTSAGDPWRDPRAAARLGPPALNGHRRVDGVPEGARLSAREVLFGRRVKPTALIALAGVALLVGAIGGVVGRMTAEGANSLTSPAATIASAQEAKERPPGSVADIAARVAPAVVSIELRVGQQGGTGSGVVIDPAGYVLTNNHVVAMAADNKQAAIEAIFHDGSRSPAAIVGRDPKTDLAVLKVSVANPTVANLGKSGELAVGDGVLAIGSPLGLVGTVTEGIVSAVDRPVRLDGDGNDASAVIDAVQTDAAVNPGNSGGPLVDSTGSVVGINTAIRTLGQGEGGSIGLGFAIPIDDARLIAESLIRTGGVKHSELGVNARSVTDGTTDGAQVQNVRPNSAAAAAGIVEGDVIVKLAERHIGSAEELIVAQREHPIGADVPIELVREGRPLVVTAKLQSD
jgi:putative serine protease PepD